MWLFLWGMSERQVELLLADQPVTIYLDDKKKKKRGKNAVGEDDFSKPSAAKIIEAQKKWTEKYGDGTEAPKKISLGSLLQKVSIDEQQKS